jgi:lysophospholipase L1-like esterase
MLEGSQTVVRRFVAIGDSLTEGVGDPRGPGLGGWADRLAERLEREAPGLEYANLAVRGWRVRHVRRHQLAPALDLRPDLVSVMAGANDAFGPGLDLARVEEDFDAVVGALTASGARVLTGTIPDLTASWPIPGLVTAPVRARFAAVNEVVRAVAARHGALLIDFWHDPRTRGPGTWSIDGIHPSAHGHAAIADAAAEVLGLPPEGGPPVAPAGLAALAARAAEVRSLAPLLGDVVLRPGLPRQRPRPTVRRAAGATRVW